MNVNNKKLKITTLKKIKTKENLNARRNLTKKRKIIMINKLKLDNLELNVTERL